MNNTFKKGSLVGTLQHEVIDHTVVKQGKIKWTTKNVLMLKDNEGRQLSSAQFRTNATKQAIDYFKSEGWELVA